MSDFDLTKIEELLDRLRTRCVIETHVYGANGKEKPVVDRFGDFTMTLEPDQDCIDAVAAIETLIRRMEDKDASKT